MRGAGRIAVAGLLAACGPDVVTQNDSEVTGTTAVASATGTSNTGLGGTDDSGGAQCEHPSFEDTHRSLWLELSGECLTRVDFDSMAVTGRYETSSSPGDDITASVGLSGDVVVANLDAQPGSPWLVKVIADPSRCDDDDGEPGIQTSNDIEPLPWGDDECVAWVVDNSGYDRVGYAVWGSGEWDPAQCRFVDERVWAVAMNHFDDAGRFDPEQRVIAFDGDTGQEIGSVVIPQDVPLFEGSRPHGIVDASNDFVPFPAALAVSPQLATASLPPLPQQELQFHYELTIDGANRLWMCGEGGGISALARLDRGAGAWLAQAYPESGGATGCFADGNDSVWWAGRDADGVDIELHQFDADTMELVARFPREHPDSGFEILGADPVGRLWIAATHDTAPYTRAFERFDPVLGTLDTIAVKCLLAPNLSSYPNRADPTGALRRNAYGSP